MPRPRKTATHDLLKFHRDGDKPTDDFTHRRGVDVLDKLIVRTPEHRAALERAHETLKDDPNHAAAMHATARALRAGRINVFVSYRSPADTGAARALAEVFRELSAGRVSVTLEDEFTGNISGRDYKSEIEQAIRDTHWFIFLASNPQVDNGWCMFETGMFRGHMVSTKIHRLICIHHPDALLPNPIDQYQAVMATPAQLAQFLDGLFRQPEPLPGWESLNPEVGADTIERLATKIATAVRPPSKPVEFNYRLTMEIVNGDQTDWKNLDQARVRTDTRTAELFGKTKPPDTWGELIQNVREQGGIAKWLSELYSVLEKASRNNIFRPVSATFQSSLGGKVMRPILHSMEHLVGHYRVHLLFVEEILSAPLHNIPPKTTALLNAKRMHDRICWEVIERFKDSQWDREEIDACAKAFSRIEREMQSFGRFDVDLLCSNYDADTRETIRAIITRWHQLRAAMKSGAEQMSGELDKAFLAYDRARVRKLLDESAQLVRRFLHTTSPVLDAIIEMH